MNLSDNMKSLREMSNLSRKQIADQIGVSLSTYTNYEGGFRKPSIELLPKIATALHVSIDSLLGYAAPAEHLRLVALVKACGLEVHEQDNLITVSISDTLRATLSEGEQKAIDNTLTQLGAISLADFDGSIHEAEKTLMERNKEQAAILFADTLGWWPIING